MSLPGFAAEYGLYRSNTHYRSNASGEGDTQNLWPADQASQVQPAYCIEFNGRVICAPSFVRCVLPGVTVANGCKCPAKTTYCFSSGSFTAPLGCKNLQTDPAHCGSCGNSCPAGDICCGGTCINTQTNAANCGSCGTACPSGSTCVAGACTCVGPTTQHCGNCGTQTRTCNNGTWSSWSACSGSGVCAPGATSTCTNGTKTCGSNCQWETCKCNSNSIFCNGACVLNNNQHCGACNVTCTGGLTCQGTTCACPVGSTRCGTGTACCPDDDTACHCCGGTSPSCPKGGFCLYDSTCVTGACPGQYCGQQVCQDPISGFQTPLQC